jgi:uncharacterized protein (DUF39 family)
MRKISLLSVLILWLFAIPVQSQKIFKVQYESQADIKVYIVEYESQCDLKVFFVDYESQADLKIYMVQYESQAGWRNPEKSHLLRIPK